MNFIYDILKDVLTALISAFILLRFERWKKEVIRKHCQKKSAKIRYKFNQIKNYRADVKKLRSRIQMGWLASGCIATIQLISLYYFV